MLKLSTLYNKSIQEEDGLSEDQLKTRHVGRQDPKRHLAAAVETLMCQNIVQNLGKMADASSF